MLCIALSVFPCAATVAAVVLRCPSSDSSLMMQDGLESSAVSRRSLLAALQGAVGEGAAAVPRDKVFPHVQGACRGAPADSGLAAEG